MLLDDDIAAVKAVMAQNQHQRMPAQNDDMFNQLMSRARAQQSARNAGAAAQGGTPQGYGAIPRALAQPQGNLGQWISQALGALHLDSSYAAGLNTMIQHESGGNPNAINRTDSNAQAGHPSQGLMQTIPGTFNQYALPGHNQILNPVDNIIAGTRYALRNYGAGMIKSGGRHDASGGYIGY